jgi:hypothetical protein
MVGTKGIEGVSKGKCKSKRDDVVERTEVTPPLY